jgi:hypothetical protein
LTWDYCIDTNGSEVDTILAFYGSEGISEIECDDDGGDGTSSAITVYAYESFSNVIVVDSRGGTGSYQININTGVCP